MRAIVTIGLGFGDESKGSACDFLTQKHGADLVVRYNGGHQAMHNVVLPDGTHHTFSQFGSGTFHGAATYIDKNVIIEPLALEHEAKHLQECGIENPYEKLYINLNCPVTTLYHKLANRIKELYRRKNNHGSCGAGIGETREYLIKHPKDAIRVIDFLNERQPDLVSKLDTLKEYYVAELKKHICADNLNEYNSLTKLNNVRLGQELRQAAQPIQIVNSPPEFKIVILEGSQGVLLDQWHGFHPHTTWSDTTDKHANEFLNQYNLNAERIGILRSHLTRHGNGPFPTEDKGISFPDHNKWGRYQGQFRFGHFDFPLLQYAINYVDIDYLFLTHLDQQTDKVCTSYESPIQPFLGENLEIQEKITEEFRRAVPIYENVGPMEVLKKFDIPIKYMSYGPTIKEKKCILQKLAVVI